MTGIFSVGIKRGDIVEVKINDLAYGGAAVGRAEGMAIFVGGAAPGERVRARIYKKKKSHAEARLLEVLEPSPLRIEPRCALFAGCGGCSWQHLPYGEQLKWKQIQVDQTLNRLSGDIKLPELLPIAGSPEQWHYRNKMEYSFGPGEDGDNAKLGFHVPGRFDRIFDVDRCHIHPAPFDKMLTILREYAHEKGLPGYDPRRHDGFFRHAVMRFSHTEQKCILMLLSTTGKLPGKEALAERLAAETPGFKGMVWGTNDGVADVARMERECWRWGDPILMERVNGLEFAISPQSFFQTNTAGAELLYARTAEMTEAGPGDTVLDAYCGAGSIGLHLARKGARRIVGVEIVKEAIWDARENAKRNGVGNTTFIAAPLGEGLKLARAANRGPFHVIVIDPPRGGMDKRSLRGLVAEQAPRFVYVSCNPATMARDLTTICEGGYEVEAIQPVDMFPHTWHIEVIARMRLKTATK